MGYKENIDMSNNVTIMGKPIQGSLIDSVKENQKGYFSSFAVDLPFSGAPSAAYYKEQIEDVPVDIPSRINRDTDAASVVKVLKETNGFDIRLWNPPTIAELPDGRRFLYDGDHSRAIYKAVFPQEKTMPGRIVPIDQLEEYHKLFIRSNARCKTAIKAEEVFVHECHAGDRDALKLASKLKNVGLKVYCSHEQGGQIGDLGGMRIKVGAAKSAFKTQERTESVKYSPSKGYTTAVKDAVSVLRGTGLSHTTEDSLPAELLQGMVMVFGCYPDLRPGGVDHDVLKKWFESKLQCNSVKQVAADFKSQGGALVNFSGWSVACGILSALREKPRAPVLDGIQSSYTTKTLNRIHGPKK